MRLRMLSLAAAVALASFSAPPPAAAQVDPDLLPVGSVAPDFSLTGITRYGTLRDPVRLSDYRGDVVVIGFFFKVRTRG